MRFPRKETISREKLRKLTDRGKSNRAIASHFKASESTIKRRIRKYGLKGIRPKGRKPINKLKPRFLEIASERIDVKKCYAQAQREVEKKEIVFPKSWKDLSEGEQREWIKTHFIPTTKIPEPILKRKDKIIKGFMKLESGTKLEFPSRTMTASKRNPNLVREFEDWIGKWLITVFHHKSFPHVKYLGVANPSTFKWIAQQLSSEILSEFYAILLKIRWKYGFFKGKRRKKRRQSSISTLSLKNNKGSGSE